MNFELAKQLIINGTPVKHPTIGRIFPLHKKESIFAKVNSSNMSKKFFLGNQNENFAVILPVNCANAELIYLPTLTNTDDWELYNDYQ